MGWPVSSDGKQYFCDMIATARVKVGRLPADSVLKTYFTPTRLAAIQSKIEGTDAKRLEWGYWQPFFLFLVNQPESAIVALDADLRAVIARSKQGQDMVCEFLRDERDVGGDSLWFAGLFEIRAKAALLKSPLVSLCDLDWPLPNGRNMDTRATIGARVMGIECTTLGDSDASKRGWAAYCSSLKDDPVQAQYEHQDAYTQGRRLYAKVFDKLAPNLDPTKCQLRHDAPNILLIGLLSQVSDLSTTSPSIGWALDELFTDQPNGSRSPISLSAFIKQSTEGTGADIDALRNSVSQISGILLFDRSRLGNARINYNARTQCRISHSEMAMFDEIFSVLPEYCL